MRPYTFTALRLLALTWARRAGGGGALFFGGARPRRTPLGGLGLPGEPTGSAFVDPEAFTQDHDGPATALRNEKFRRASSSAGLTWSYFFEPGLRVLIHGGLGRRPHDTHRREAAPNG